MSTASEGKVTITSKHPAIRGSNPPVSTDPDAMPRRFGKYTLLRKLAVGGMAELFLALQRSVAGFEKLIVVKRILPHLVKDKAFVELILQEARISATLNHPNICHIYDVGEAEGQFYIAMEHIHGEDLRAIVRQMKVVNEPTFPMEHTLSIVLGCCAGLAHAHEKMTLDGEPMNIVHRDVSPQNILVTFNGDVKLVDFGIAKAGRSTMEDTGSGQLKGKIPYMSPEQAQGQALDGRSDIFSLGIILFELTTGRRLFRGANEMETLRTIVDTDYPTPRSIHSGIPVELERIILKSLEKNPDDRYQTARQMQQDLENFVRSSQIKVSPISAGEWMQRLFADKLAEQKAVLAEGRQMAEAISAQVAAEEAFNMTQSGVRQKQGGGRGVWLGLLVLSLAAVAGVAAFFAMQPPAQTPQPGSLVVHSTPEGASITIDGAIRPERTPTTITALPLAHYRVQISSEGFVPAMEEVDLTTEAPSSTIEVTLARPTASSVAMVNVQTTPAGAHVIVDGVDTTHVTPFRVEHLEPSIEHTVVVSLDGWVTQTRTLTMRAGQVEDMSFSLERTPLGANEAMLVLTTDPPDARVQLDSTWYEGGSPYYIRVPARAYRLRVVQSAYRMREQEVRLEGGQSRDLAVELERERSATNTGHTTRPETPTNPGASGPGMLTVAATPWCNVSVDGRAVGETPVVNHSLPSGRHTISCTNPELNVTRHTHGGDSSRARQHVFASTFRNSVSTVFVSTLPESSVDHTPRSASLHLSSLCRHVQHVSAELLELLVRIGRNALDRHSREASCQGLPLEDRAANRHHAWRARVHPLAR